MNRIIVASSNKGEIDWLTNELLEFGRIVRSIGSLDLLIPTWELVEGNILIIVDSVVESDSKLLSTVNQIALKRTSTILMFIHSRGDEESGWISNLSERGVLCVSFNDIEPGVVERLLMHATQSSHEQKLQASVETLAEEVIIETADETTVINEIQQNSFENQETGHEEEVTEAAESEQVELIEEEEEADPDPEIVASLRLESKNDKVHPLSSESYKEFLEPKSAPLKDKLVRKVQEIHKSTKSLFESEEEDEELLFDVSERTQITERIVGTMVISIAGTDRRTGCTHTAIQVSQYLSQLGYAVACVELLDSNISPPAFRLFKSDEATKKCKGGFVYNGIDFYPAASPFQLMGILSGGYKYVVLDMGQIMLHATASKKGKVQSRGKYAMEFFRANLQLLVTGAAIWDFDKLVHSLDAFFSWGWQGDLRILVQFADDKVFNEVSNSFTGKEKKHLNIHFFKQPFTPGLFNRNLKDDDQMKRLLQSVLPREAKKRKGWFR